MTIMQEDVENVLQPFVEDGPELSVEVTDQKLPFHPSPRANHWDYGAMDFIDNYWEFATATSPSDSTLY